MVGLDFFVLGIFTIIFVGIVVVMLMAWKYIYQLKRSDIEIENNLQIIDRTFALHEREADIRFENICKDYELQIERNQKENNDRIDELYRYVDSRFDKFENKINERLSK